MDKYILLLLAALQFGCAGEWQTSENQSVPEGHALVSDMIVSEDLLLKSENGEDESAEYGVELQNLDLEGDDEEFLDELSLSGTRNKKVKTWTRGVVPVYFPSNISADRKESFMKICNESVGEQANITCVQQSTSTRRAPVHLYVRLVTGKVEFCGRSYIGRQKNNGPQNIYVHEKCWKERTIAHELMHALGIVHEQSRPDRDKFVTIKFENINKEYESNFRKLSYSQAATTEDYDYDSVMHYHGYSFSKNGKPTIISKKTGKPTNGRNKLSQLDHDILISIYGHKSVVGASRNIASDDLARDRSRNVGYQCVRRATTRYRCIRP